MVWLVVGLFQTLLECFTVLEPIENSVGMVTVGDNMAILVVLDGIVDCK